MLDGLAKTLYVEIVAAANRFLHLGLSTPIKWLQDEDPSLEKVAQLIEDTRKIIHPALFDHDPTLADQAADYCEIMLGMGKAIAEGNEKALHEFVELLRRKPGNVPP